ncbi:THxN family PEP-CTERM protein [Denitrobaculum tricleocarpae]|nr:THxN family PEP-CTERM protein [Denitrobaculum tricleocarpae]
MSKFTKFLGGAALAVTLAAGATQASAGTLITDWSYEVQTGFVAFTPQPTVTGSGNNGDLPAPFTNAPTVLSWGTGDDGPSQLEVSKEVISTTGGLITNDLGGVNGALLTHRNRTIGPGPTLETATIFAPLTLTPFSPAGPALDPFDIAFNIVFEETTNFPANGGDCTPGTGGTPCADIFVLLNPGSLSTSFILDGFEYTISLFSEDLGVLSDEACAAAGAEAGCIGFITPEGEISTLQTKFNITARAVPEPGTLALLGLGLLGLGIARRRKVAA